MHVLLPFIYQNEVKNEYKIQNNICNSLGINHAIQRKIVDILAYKRSR